MVRTRVEPIPTACVYDALATEPHRQLIYICDEIGRIRHYDKVMILLLSTRTIHNKTQQLKTKKLTEQSGSNNNEIYNILII